MGELVKFKILDTRRTNFPIEQEQVRRIVTWVLAAGSMLLRELSDLANVR